MQPEIIALAQKLCNNSMFRFGDKYADFFASSQAVRRRRTGDAQKQPAGVASRAAVHAIGIFLPRRQSNGRDD
jgi:hypothetical protein